MVITSRSLYLARRAPGRLPALDFRAPLRTVAAPTAANTHLTRPPPPGIVY